jgi:co-chaperonin GroES (HSP10)
MPTIEKKEEIFALGNNVLVEMIEESETNEAGLAIPKSSQDRESCGMGIVLSTGLRKIIKKVTEGETTVETESELPQELLLLETFNLQRGDTVLLKKFDYTKVRVGDDSKEYRIYDVKSIIGKIKKPLK